MRTNDAYSGYSYQKRCALYYLLDKFNEKEFSAISLEHSKGDDFDIHYLTKKEVYQTKSHKNIFSSNMKEFIKIMWRRYSENINNPPSSLDIKLAFIFPTQFNAFCPRRRQTRIF